MIHHRSALVASVAALGQLAGRHFCASHVRPEQFARVNEIGQGVIHDKSAFSQWRRGAVTSWPTFYASSDRWLGFPAIRTATPDLIDGGSQLQDALLRGWPFGHCGESVWYMDEPLSRLLRLCSELPRDCIGSTAEYRKVMSDLWRRRIDKCWNALSREHRHLPWVHMLRGMQCSGEPWPNASVDSTDVAQNDWRPQNTPRGMADGWDALQTPGAWELRPEQMELVA